MSFRWECPEGKCPEGRCTARRGRRRCCGHQAVESAEAHEDDGGLENRYLLDFRGAGQAEADLLVAAENVPLEAGTTQVTGAPLAGESGLAATIPAANKHAVVVLSVLIEKPSVHEGANDPWGKEIHEDPVPVWVRRRQGEGRFLPGRRRLGAGGLSRPGESLDRPW